MADLDAKGRRKLQLSPSDDVYSYFMFASPVEEYKTNGGFTYNICLSYVLVLVSLFLQSVLTYCIYKSIVIGHSDWRQSVISTELGADGCNAFESLCFIKNGSYSCAPPSVQLTSKWSELDADGDGIWTRDEVTKMKDKLQCSYGVNPVEVFDVFVNYLRLREDLLWLHPDVKAGKAISEPYFKYAKGDIIMCGYRNTNMCANLLERGVFDAPLFYNTSPRVGNTITSALDYCHELLEDGGICDQTLPSTYTVWKKSSKDQCYGSSFEKAVYKHKKTGQEKSLLLVNYDAASDYARADRSLNFSTYQGVVLIIYLLAMFIQVKEIVVIVTWVLKFPSSKGLGSEAVTKKEDKDITNYTINGVSMKHRLIVAFFATARLVLTLSMAYTGVLFILKTTSYLDLVLNCLGLIFVVGISTELYAQMLNRVLRKKAEECISPMEVPMIGPQSLNRNPALKDLLWFAIIVMFLFASTTYYNYTVVKPVTTALECACLSQGSQCYEAQQFTSEFWKTYWTKDVPEVFKDVENLKKAGTVTMLSRKHSHRHHHQQKMLKVRRRPA